MDSSPAISKIHWLVRVLTPLSCILAAGLIVGLPMGWLARNGPRNNDQEDGGRGIRDARFSYENDHPDGLPPVALTDIYAYAAVLARAGELNDVQPWFSRLDPLAAKLPESILNPNEKQENAPINPAFQGAPLAWAVALLPNMMKLPSATPWLWTRGLQPDGTWRKDSPYGGEGGIICFLGGNSQFCLAGKVNLVKWGTDETTHNILEALPPGTRVGEYTPTAEDRARIANWVRHQFWITVTKGAGSWFLVLACSEAVARVQNPWAKRAGIAMGVVGAAWFWFVLAA
jgi:hypothetical protein